MGNVPGKNDKKTGLIPLWLYKKNSPHKLLEHAATLKENQFEMIVINNWTNLLLSKNGVFLLNNPGQENGTYATEIARLGPENINATLGMYFSHISAPRAAAAAISLGDPLGIVMGLVAGGPIGIMQRRSYSGYSFEINPAEAKTLNSKLSDGAGEVDNEGKISFNVNDFSSATGVRVRRYLGADERILSYPYIAVETLALFLGASALNHRMSQNDDDDEEKEKAKKTNPPDPTKIGLNTNKQSNTNNQKRFERNKKAESFLREYDQMRREEEEAKTPTTPNESSNSEKLRKYFFSQ